MKTIYKVLPLFLFSMTFFTSCEDELEVGTPLYPVEEEFNGPKVYINEKGLPANSKSVNVVKTPIGIVVNEEVDSFYVYSAVPVDEDVTVTISESEEVAAKFNKDATPVSGVVNFLQGTVTIPKGAQKSSEPVVYAMKNAEPLSTFGKKGVVALAITDVKGYAAAGKNNNAYCLQLNLQVKNIKEYGDLSKFTMLGKDDYTATWGGGNDASNLFDEDFYSGISVSKDFTVTLDLSVARNFVGIGYAAGEYDKPYKARNVKVEVSTDGVDYQDMGVFVLPKAPQNAQECMEFTPVELYGAMSCKFVKLTFSKTAYTGTYYEMWYDNPTVKELRVYVK